MARSTRDRPAKPPLSSEAVVDAGLEILRTEGLAAVTMRRVASVLDTGAASLYVYVSGREALLQAMLDRVTATIELETPDPKRWRAQLHSLLERMFQTLVAHPGMAEITIGDPPTTETILLVTENLFSILLAGGLEPQHAAWGVDILVLLVTSSAHEDGIRQGFDQDEKIESIFTELASLPPDRYPNVVRYAREMVTGDGDERFRFAIDLIVDGLVAKSARKGK